MISGESVVKACSEVDQYTPEQMVNEFERFFRVQPAICDFIVDITHESGQKIQELSLFLSYMVFKSLEGSPAVTTPTVKPDDIEAAYRTTESWMEGMIGAPDADLQSAIVQSLQHETEPYLLQYVISELNEPLQSGAELNDEEKGEVFFVLKTVISSLCNKGRIIEIS